MNKIEADKLMSEDVGDIRGFSRFTIELLKHYNIPYGAWNEPVPELKTVEDVAAWMQENKGLAVAYADFLKKKFRLDDLKDVIEKLVADNHSEVCD
jgi:hypothetical protein